MYTHSIGCVEMKNDLLLHKVDNKLVLIKRSLQKHFESTEFMKLECKRRKKNHTQSFLEFWF